MFWWRFFESMQGSPFSLNFCSLSLPPLVDLACGKYYCGILMVIFVFLTHSTLITWNSSVGKRCRFFLICLVSSLVISLLILYQYELLGIYYILLLIIHYYQYLFCCSGCSTLPIGDSFRFPPVTFLYAPILFIFLLIFSFLCVCVCVYLYVCTFSYFLAP